MTVSSLLLLLSSCAGGPEWYGASYKARPDQPTLINAYLLNERASPKLIFTDDIEGDLESFINQNYVVVGESIFNGPEKKANGAFKVAKNLKVTHVLIQRKYLYVGSKKAYKFYGNVDYIPVGVAYNGYYRRTVYDRVPNPIAVPYAKEFSIYNHRAIYLVKLK